MKPLPKPLPCPVCGKEPGCDRGIILGRVYFYLRWWRHRAQYSLPERIGCYRARRNQPLEQDGEAMNVYVWDRISRVSNRYHGEGGVVVFAETEDRARELANEIEGCEIEPTDVVTDVRSVRGGVERVYIFPDAGCC